MGEQVERRRALPVGILLLILAAVLAIGWVELFRVGPAPQVRINPAVPVIGRRNAVTVEVSEPGRGLSRIKVELVQGDLLVSLAEKTYSYPSEFWFWGNRTPRDSVTVQVGRDSVPGLKPGKASVRVTAGRTGTWLRHPGPFAPEITLPVQLTPPSLQILSTQTYVAQGGCEAVVYRVGETAIRDGVRAGSWWFPGHPLPGGGTNDRFAFFAAPYDMGVPDVRLLASDAAANEAEVAFVDQFSPKKFKEDAVELSDAFMGKVVPEIMGQTPGLGDRGSLLDNYLAINRDLRKQNAQELVTLAGQSRPEFLWDKTFLSMRNGKVMAGFADARSYLVQGRVVDHQTHLGYDLAVTRHAPVPAANDGVVLQARYFGIYGNTVVIDHGYGVMSLYGHLSSITVSPGQKVARGDVIGQTGETGLAGGDHLHFAILLDGLPVNPVEWWDAHWIGDRIAHKLGSGFPFKG